MADETPEGPLTGEGTPEGAPEPAASEAPPTGGDDAPTARRIHPWTVIKGCGCVSATGVLGAAVMMASGGDMASVGAGLVGILILVLVVGLSGTNGWWTND